MAYKPNLHATSNKPLGVAQGVPTDARSYFYDEANFTYRPYASTAEVLSYLASTAHRAGNFPIYIKINNVVTEWSFKDSTSDAGLVQKVANTNPPALELFTLKELTDGATINWAFDVNPAIVSISGNRTLNITGPIAGKPTFGTLVVNHTSAGSKLTLPGNSAGVKWSETAGTETQLDFLWTGSKYIWRSNLSGSGTTTTTPTEPSNNVLAAPSLIASSVSATQNNVTVGTVQGAISYELDYVITGQTNWARLSTAAGVFGHQGLNPNTSYTYRARAIASDAANNSPYKQVTQVTSSDAVQTPVMVIPEGGVYLGNERWKDGSYYTRKLPANTSGSFYSFYEGGILESILSLNGSSRYKGYFITDGVVYSNHDGAGPVPTAFTVPLNVWVGFRRVGTTLRFMYSSNEVDWTIIEGIEANSTAELYGGAINAYKPRTTGTVSRYSNSVGTPGQIVQHNDLVALNGWSFNVGGGGSVGNHFADSGGYIELFNNGSPAEFYRENVIPRGYTVKITVRTNPGNNIRILVGGGVINELMTSTNYELVVNTTDFPNGNVRFSAENGQRGWIDDILIEVVA